MPKSLIDKRHRCNHEGFHPVTPYSAGAATSAKPPIIVLHHVVHLAYRRRVLPRQDLEEILWHGPLAEKPPDCHGNLFTD